MRKEQNASVVKNKLLNPKPLEVKKGILQKVLNRVGVQVKMYPDLDMKRRLRIIRHFGVDTLLDIGAATGEYAVKMRETGYGKRIISFEPLKASFAVLQKKSLRYKDWLVCNYALGDVATKVYINVAGNSDSSSLLNMLPEHIRSEPSSRYIKKEAIEVRKLDNVYYSFFQSGDAVMMKIDVQGYEKSVLEGAKEFLKHVRVIQLEMSLVPLYENQPLFIEMIDYLKEKEFQLFSLENGFSNPQTGQLLQVDGIFVKEALTR